MERKIKSRTIYTINYVILEPGASQLEEDRYISSYLELDQQGNPAREEQYDQEGALLERYARAFYDNGLLKTEEYETGEEGVVSTRAFIYDRDGKLLEERGAYSHGGNETIHYQYDEAGRIISRLCMDDMEEEEFREEYKYNGDKMTEETRWEYGDRISRRKSKYEDGLLVEVSEEQYQEGSRRDRRFTYDEKRRTETEAEFINGKILTHKGFQYDDQDRVVSIAEEEAFRRDRLELSYDAAGNLVKQEEYDIEGKLLQQVTRTYDSGGRVAGTEVFHDSRRTGYTRKYALEYMYDYHDLPESSPDSD